MAEMGCGQSVTSGRGSWRGWVGGGQQASPREEDPEDVARKSVIGARG